MFNPNDAFMYVVVAVVVVLVIAESVYFLLKALKRAKELEISKQKLRKVVSSTAVYTIAPAVAILLGVIALSKALGFPFPWLRLSVIGALTYETTAAATTANVLGLSLSELITDPKAFTAIAWVMTLGIIPGPILVTVLGKRIEGTIDKVKAKDKRWGEIFLAGLFLGMISAFLGMVFSAVGEGLKGWIGVFVMLASAAIMGICGLLCRSLKIKWLEDYALPISLLGGMALSIPITTLITSIA